MEAAAIETAARRKQNPPQVALLPANALNSRRFPLSPHPVSSRLVPLLSPLEGHTDGTCGQQGEAAGGHERLYRRREAGE